MVIWNILVKYVVRSRLTDENERSMLRQGCKIRHVSGMKISQHAGFINY